ncbi:MAG: riboflavin synthase [Pseudomonadota bacterium]|nr:riboflavin synthase [Pseudomonadota bacterium]
MFTGIIRDVGQIAAIDKTGDWTVTVATGLTLDAIGLGASIACSGICLTVIDKSDGRFKVQLSAETVSKTTAHAWQPGDRLNLEPALRIGDELGGHMLAGHVDGLAEVLHKAAVGDSLQYEFEVPQDFGRYLASKGSVSLDGVSLTVNEVSGTRFYVNVIPYTQQVTTLGHLVAGDFANFEVDLIARYVERMMKQDQTA